MLIIGLAKYSGSVKYIKYLKTTILISIMGIVYKLTCEETNNVYYGSTKHDIHYRKAKGWYHCACNEFVNPKIEVVEECDNYREKEDFYIRNFECINKQVVIQTEEDVKNQKEKNKDKKKIADKNYREKILQEKRFYCELCDVNCSCKSHLKKHNEGYRHKLKYESFLKYGENWKEYYSVDNKKRYAENKKNVNNLNKK